MIIYHGEGLLNRAINSLPIELHIPGYNFCGPGTKLKKRLLRGDNGINDLDNACKEHDISYSKSKSDLKLRHHADKILQEKAWSRVVSKDASIKEKAAALAVTNAMKIKQKLGMGIKRKNKKKLNMKLETNHNMFRKAIRSASAAIKKSKIKNTSTAIKVALKAAKKIIKGKKPNIKSRIIPIPKTGGILPFLIPLFAGLSAAGALAGGAAGITKAVTSANAAKKKLHESERHNKMMEAIALGKKDGKGLYLKPYRKGLGLYLSPPPATKNY